MSVEAFAISGMHRTINVSSWDESELECHHLLYFKHVITLEPEMSLNIYGDGGRDRVEIYSPTFEKLVLKLMSGGRDWLM